MRGLRHLQSALSRGTGYEPTPPSAGSGAGGDWSYYLDFRAKTRSPSAAAPRALVPAGLAQLGLGWWERTLAGEPGAEERFGEICRLLLETSVEEDGARLWRYQVVPPKYPLRAPWISALAQAQAASVFVRAFVRHGDERDAAAALAALRPLLQDRQPTVLARLSAGPAPEECPTDPPSLILNGWIYASWGLHDVAVGLDSDPARRMLDDVLACLRELLPRFDAGWWSRYSLFPHRRPDLAKVFYHRLHADQLEITAALSGERVFAETAARWRRYDTRFNRVRLTAQKAMFVATGYR